MLYGVFGTGGCARGVLAVARAQLRANGIADEQLVWIEKEVDDRVVNGHLVTTYEAFVDSCGGKGEVAIGIANPHVRQRLARQVVRDGLEFFSPRANNVVVMDDVVIGRGACLSPFVTLTCNIRIGDQFQAHIYSYVEHDCSVGSYVTLAPGAKINGNVVIEDLAYIGAGAIIRQGRSGDPLVIGEGAVVGMGAVVTKNVSAGDVVYGNPARVRNSNGYLC